LVRWTDPVASVAKRIPRDGSRGFSEWIGIDESSTRHRRHGVLTSSMHADAAPRRSLFQNVTMRTSCTRTQGNRGFPVTQVIGHSPPVVAPSDSPFFVGDLTSN